MDYLERNTNYAVLLTAPWGTGKTYYLENYFFKALREKKKYTPVRISLFGLTSIEEIKNRLLVALYPILGNKWLKLGTGVVSAMLKSADFLLPASETGEILGKGLLKGITEEVEGLGKKAKGSGIGPNLERLLICFDDMERLNQDKLAWRDFLGYVNSIVEERNIKVLLIANDDKIDDEVYKSIREKTIATTVHFVQEFEVAYRMIVESGDFTERYKKYLMENVRVAKLHLKDAQGQVNLRTLKYFVSYFSNIYEFVHTGLKVKDLDGHMQALSDQLFLFALLVCAELKAGKISFTDRKDLDEVTQFSVMYLLQQEGAKPEKDYAARTILKYFPHNGYFFYAAVYDYVTGGNILDRELLKKEICNAYNVREGHISEAYQLLNKLKARDYLAMEDAEYRKSLRQLRSFALADEYGIWECVSVFWLLRRDGNPLRLSLEKLSKDLVRVVYRGDEAHTYHGAWASRVHVDQGDPDYKFLAPIRDSVLAVNKKALGREQASEGDWIRETLFSNIDELYDEMLKSQGGNDALSFRFLRPKDFLTAFGRGDNRQRLQLLNLVGYVYLEMRHNTREDMLFLRGLLDLLARDRNKKGKGNRAVLYRRLEEEVEKRSADRSMFYPSIGGS